MKQKNKFMDKIKLLKDTFSRSRGKGHTKTETQIFNHPRRDKAVRTGRK